MLATFHCQKSAFTAEDSNSISLPCLLQLFSIHEPSALEADQPKKKKKHL